jgi:acetyltransferase-like isoleucine patch superfamily enzyme
MKLLVVLQKYYNNHFYVRKIDGKANKIVNQGFFRKVNIEIKGNNNKIIIGKKSSLRDVKICIKGNNHTLCLGQNVVFSGELWFEDENCTIQIGENSTVEWAHIAVTEPNNKIAIGNDCMLSNEIQIRTGDSHSILNNLTGQRINFAKNVFIGEHVWIGARAIILKGVSIGNNSIIGTASVVTKNVEANSIAAGNPAQIIKNNVIWNRKRIYKK